MYAIFHTHYCHATFDVISLHLTVFTNPEDPNDRSFEPDAFPAMELEFPNNHACERSVSMFVHRKATLNMGFRYLLLAPKDKDHYHPVYCLEATLYTMIECGHIAFLVTKVTNNNFLL